MESYYVLLTDIIKKMKLTNLTPEVAIENIRIDQTDLNRPALQLVGYYDYFDPERVQIIGKVEYNYLGTLSESIRHEMLKKLFSFKIPCLILSRELTPYDEMITFSKKFNVPILQTKMPTSYFNSELNRYLKVELAPRITKHGVLVDVYGEGVLILGESGIGKSEVALELIKRGHRLVADDAVEIKKVSDDTLIGTSPPMIRHFIEVRGIGIVDCKMLFGVESVRDIHTIDLCIQLEEWQKSQSYERLGLDEQYIEILGNQVISHVLPVRPGRNIAIIVETTALNHRQKKMGYNAALEVDQRIRDYLKKQSEDTENGVVFKNVVAKEEPSISSTQINYREDES